MFSLVYINNNASSAVKYCQSDYPCTNIAVNKCDYCGKLLCEGHTSDCITCGKVLCTGEAGGCQDERIHAPCAATDCPNHKQLNSNYCTVHTCSEAGCTNEATQYCDVCKNVRCDSHHERHYLICDSCELRYCPDEEHNCLAAGHEVLNCAECNTEICNHGEEPGLCEIASANYCELCKKYLCNNCFGERHTMLDPNHVCVSCGEKPAVKYCDTCNKPICADCFSSHECSDELGLCEQCGTTEAVGRCSKCGKALCEGDIMIPDHTCVKPYCDSCGEPASWRCSDCDGCFCNEHIPPEKHACSVN